MATYLKPEMVKSLSAFHCVHYDTRTKLAEIQTLDVIVDGQINLYYKQRLITPGFVIAGVFASRTEAEEFAKEI